MRKYDFEVVLHPKVHFDLQEGVDYYKTKQIGLGNRFYHSARTQISSLNTDAFLYELKYDDTRCVQVPSFPYLIHYKIDVPNNEVLIYGVIHTSKEPKNWKKKRK